MQQSPQALDRNASWALLPIVNHTQTPQAGLRAEAILESLVRAGGVQNLRKYPTALNSESLFEPAERAAVDKALAWATELDARYALTGTVDEWRYKVGVDGEPAVGLTLQLIDLKSGSVIWTATGSKTGWSREALSAVAQKLLSQLSAPLASSATPAATQEPVQKKLLGNSTNKLPAANGANAGANAGVNASVNASVNGRSDAPVDTPVEKTSPAKIHAGSKQPAEHSDPVDNAVMPVYPLPNDMPSYRTAPRSLPVPNSALPAEKPSGS